VYSRINGKYNHEGLGAKLYEGMIMEKKSVTGCGEVEDKKRSWLVKESEKPPWKGK